MLYFVSFDKEEERDKVTNSYICPLPDRDNAQDRGQVEKLDLAQLRMV